MRLVSTKRPVPEAGLIPRVFCSRYARLLKDKFIRHFEVKAAAAPSERQ